ncbi:hypothetical protein CKALI_05510 [Corynebacterium kalinowskii]|uniref:Uncharacterized protein n=1 Tax=Corynebacterium kalinowskii TaxID=2675216 RepID=A0A6B8VA19_9CORY|nr:hypothetical protein CKALI_05510 [Corynebacterium kalinowskii]
MKALLKWAGLITAIPVTLLGVLWAAQGFGLVEIDPIACVGDCQPLKGPNWRWAVAGVLTVIGGMTGVLVLTRSLRPKR